MINSYSLTRAIRFAETDASGCVAFPVYFRLMEEAEYAFLRQCGLSVVLSDEHGVLGFPRLAVAFDLHQHAQFPDELTTRLELVNLDGKQIEYRFEIRRSSDSSLTGTGEYRVACCRFPDNEEPYAILTPEYVMDRMSDRNSFQCS